MTALSRIDRQVFESLKQDVGADFVLEMVETYCDDSRQQIHTLLSALDQGDAVTFRRAAHSLKSTSLIFGAMEFGEMARELEFLGRDGKLDEAGEKCQQLTDASEVLYRLLREMCDE
jgi:HPt (histidine-containing phosphotransfer) domain-containing protein